MGGPRPLTIFFEDDPIPMIDMRMHQLKLTMEVSSPFPYMDSKMIPWNYNYNYVHEPVAANILGIGGMTRSERCYALVFVEIVPLNPIKESPK